MKPEDIAKIMTEDPDFIPEPVPSGPAKFTPMPGSIDILIGDIQKALNTAIRLKKLRDPDDPEREARIESTIQNLITSLQALGAPVPRRKRSTGELAF